MRRITTLTMTAILAATLGAFATDAQAETYPGTGEFEIYAGWFWPDEEGDTNLDDLTYGVRLGYNFTEHFGLSGTLGYWEADDTAFGGFVDSDALFFDISFEWLVNPEDLAVFVVYGGPGLVSTETSFVDPGDFTKNFLVDGEEFSVHFGLGARISAGERWFLRPDVRLRWFDDGHPLNGNDEELSWEATFGVGWYIGEP